MIVKINEKADKYIALFAKAFQALSERNLLKEGVSEAERAEGRFLSLNHYLAHAKELFTIDAAYLMIPLDEPTFDIDANTRNIKASKITVLQNDNNAETIQFTVDRYFDQMDLKEARIFVQWTLKSGKEGATYADEMRDFSTPDKIRFGWTLTDDVTSEPGVVKYSVRFWNKATNLDTNKDEVVYSLNTLSSSFVVTESLQPLINEDPDEIVAPRGSGLFERAIRNSQISVEGVPLPLNPYFSAPGTNLKPYESLENDTLTLKAQAVVGDIGSIAYEWYYKPAVELKLVIDEAEVVYSSEVFYPYNDVEDAEGNIVLHGFKHFGGIVNNEVYEKFDYKAAGKLTPGDRYFVFKNNKYSPYTETVVPETGDLYEKFTTYTVPNEGKVTGQYEVRATNTISPNTTPEEPSITCQLISPDDVKITNDLPTSLVLEDGKSADLKVAIAKQASNDTVISYVWSKGTDSNIIDETIADANDTSDTYTVASPGYYQVAPKASLNREDKYAESRICTVTFEPKIPAMSYTEEAQAKINNEDGFPVFDETDVTLEVVMASVVPEEYEGYDEKLFSEEMTYAWTVQIHDDKARFLTAADIESGLITSESVNEPILKVHSPGVDAYLFKCYVTNKLNGKTVVSTDDEVLSFYVS